CSRDREEEEGMGSAQEGAHRRAQALRTDEPVCGQGREVRGLMKQARFWVKADENKVRCFLCAHRCLIADSKTGVCGVRKNEGGVLYSLVWGRSISANVDPIEKKPLFHFLPGSSSFSIATVGCNFKCAFCQNSDISQYPQDTGRITGD